MYWVTSHIVWTIHTAHYTGICSDNTGYVLRNQSHCLNHAYSPWHRSETCIQLIINDYVLKTQAWYWETRHTVLTINTAYYTGIWSQNTDLVLRNQSHCLNHAYSPLHRPEPCIQLIIKDYVLKKMAMYWETSHIVWTMHTTHYTGLWSQNTGYVLRNQSHCLNHAYSSLYRNMFSEHRLGTEKPVTLSEPCIQLIIQVYDLKTQAMYWETSHTVWTMHTAYYTGLCSENTGLVLRNQSHCLNHQYSSLYRYMVSKHRLGTEKPVTLSEPCIQPITQVWTMHTAHYKRLCSEKTGYVLRNQSYCLNHAYSPLHRSEPCIHLIIKDYVLSCSENTGLVLRNLSHCLNHQYSSLYRTMHTAHYTGLNHAYSSL